MDKIKKAPNLVGMVLYLWSWGVSNPRPNKELNNFLHVYLILVFEIRLEISNPNLILSFLKFCKFIKAINPLS